MNAYSLRRRFPAGTPVRILCFLVLLALAGEGPPARAVEISDTPLDAVRGEDGEVVSGHTLSACGRVFQTRYRPDDWSGDVLAFAWDPHTGLMESGGGEALWRAAEQLAKDGVTHDSRRIVTYGGIWQEPRGVPFRYDDLSGAQKRMLGSDLIGGSPADRKARRMVDFLRGAAVPGLRERAGRLGDIVHSAPVLAGETLFVGANDGMLHAFDARTGKERFAYVPHLVFDHLKSLGEPHYLDGHRYYVDATASAGEVVEDLYQRATYLVGGLGKGGRGYYCLRVGSRRRVREGAGFGPYQETFSVDGIEAGACEREIGSLVRWEYPRPAFPGHGGGEDDGVSDPDMGYSFGQGYVVNAHAPDGEYRPVVIFGNGYNSPSGRAVLYILDAPGGTLLRKIDTGAGDDNGLSTPALVDADLDRRVDYVYAGDLKGNLWKFDLRADDPRYWGVAFGDDLGGDGVIDAADGDVPRPLFQARGQPITGRPDVMAMHNACAPRASGYMVVFGTGRYLGASDRFDTSQQSIYGIWDAGDAGGPLGYLTRRSSGRLSSGRYLARRVVVEHFHQEGLPARRLSDWNTEAPSGVEGAIGGSHGSGEGRIETAGWFFDFPGEGDPDGYPGERVTGNAAVRGGTAILVSFATSPEPDRGGDVSWINILHMCGAGSAAAEGIDPLLWSRRYTGRINDNPAIFKTAPASRLEQVMVVDSSGRIVEAPFSGEVWGRIFWRQDWRE